MMALSWITDAKLTAIVAEKQECTDVNGRWQHFKSSLVKDAEQTLGQSLNQRQCKKALVTDEMTDITEARHTHTHTVLTATF